MTTIRTTGLVLSALATTLLAGCSDPAPSGGAASGTVAANTAQPEAAPPPVAAPPANEAAPANTVAATELPPPPPPVSPDAQVLEDADVTGMTARLPSSDDAPAAEPAPQPAAE